MFTRRNFILSSLLSMIGCRSILKPITPGKICGANHKLAHSRSTKKYPPVSENISLDVLIIGGGISGLSAARRLVKEGISDILIVDLESKLGGNSIGGKNQISAYPWGAHYLPLPNNSNTALLNLLEEINVLKTTSGKPEYAEEYLCASPQERLYAYGKWQNGLVPQRGVQQTVLAELERFHLQVDNLKNQLGNDGKYIFDIPVSRSSQDPEFLSLDQMTMHDWLVKNSFSSEELHWYINYCCRDDYGTDYRQASAWAGLHYFSSRRADPFNSSPDNVLTWSEGNFWLVNKIKEQLKVLELTNSIVFDLEYSDQGCIALCYDQTNDKTISVKAKACVLAVPEFVRSKLLKRDTNPDYSYAPWVVANITLSKAPAGEKAALSWDNVVYNSPLLGYVHAKHQIHQAITNETVITYYYPISEYHPDTARILAYNMTITDWQNIFLDELLKIHPELKSAIENIDIWIWGHAMIRPVPGFLTNKSRFINDPVAIYSAHSDLSGISIFEEAFYQGIKAGEGVLDYFGKKSTTWL